MLGGGIITIIIYAIIPYQVVIHPINKHISLMEN